MPAPTTFTFGDCTYMIGPLGAIAQNDIARKLAVALIRLAGIRKAHAAAAAVPRKEGEPPPTPPGLPSQARAFCALSADVSNEDMAQALDLCLGVVQRQMADGRGWAPIRANGQIMFPDVDNLDAINQIVLQVLDAYRIVDFFADLPSVSPAPVGTMAQAGRGSPTAAIS